LDKANICTSFPNGINAVAIHKNSESGFFSSCYEYLRALARRSGRMMLNRPREKSFQCKTHLSDACQPQAGNSIALQENSYTKETHLPKNTTLLPYFQSITM